MKQVIEKNIQEALALLQKSGQIKEFELPVISVTEPKSPEFGEYTTNVALVIAGRAGMKPLEVANLVQQSLPSDHYLVEVLAPGYLNFRLTDGVLATNIQKILDEQGKYGNGSPEKPQRVNNEFISANPTGPLHIGNGRGGYFGDTLTRLLRKMGNEVVSEYYINDAGEQIEKLGHSVLQDEEAVYGGEYISELQEKLGDVGNDPLIIGKKAAELVIQEYIRPTVEQGMQIQFDAWTSEYELVQSGIVERAIQTLGEQGRTFEHEGALWLRTTEFGDDKDRVLIKKDGGKTYFASECGYILSKIEQNFSIIIEIWGADHHGYTKRFEAAARALGFTGEVVFLLMQLVKLMKDGEEVRMSKRAGNVVTLDELIETVGSDVARFFFLLYSPDTHMTFDLGLAEERSQKNPVFYVQYAHARMASILEKAAGENLTVKTGDSLTHEKERALARELYLFPEFLERAAADYAPHRLCQYALRLSDVFHSFYGAVQVIDTENKQQSENRLALVLATKTVLAETLSLIGVSAPDKM